MQARCNAPDDAATTARQPSGPLTTPDALPVSQASDLRRDLTRVGSACSDVDVPMPLTFVVPPPDPITLQAPSDAVDFANRENRSQSAVGDVAVGSDLVTSCEQCYADYDFSETPACLGAAYAEFMSLHPRNNFLKGCKWSPDGSCLLTSSDDNRLRLFALPDSFYAGDYFSQSSPNDMHVLLRVSEGGTVYDYCWYPSMNAADAATCCFASTSADAPIHLWDGFTGGLRASYLGINHLDELSPACSLAFSLDGRHLYAGFDRMIRVFDTSRPGRQVEDRPTCLKGRAERQPGIISCIAMSPADSIYAAGSYSRSVAVYSETDGNAVFVLYGHEGGVTQLRFSPDGRHLLSGARKDNEILCWDIRTPGKVLFTVKRQVDTNQRLYFDIDASGRYLFTGNSNGKVSIFDMHISASAPSSSAADTELNEQLLLPVYEFTAHGSCINGSSLHPSLPLLATSSGQRIFEIVGVSDDDSEDETEKGSVSTCLTGTSAASNGVFLWWIGRR